MARTGFSLFPVISCLVSTGSGEYAIALEQTAVLPPKTFK